MHVFVSVSLCVCVYPKRSVLSQRRKENKTVKNVRLGLIIWSVQIVCVSVCVGMSIVSLVYCVLGLFTNLEVRRVEKGQQGLQL